MWQNSPELTDSDAKRCLCAFKRRDRIVILGLSTSRLWRWTDSGSEGGVWGREKVWVGRVQESPSMSLQGPVWIRKRDRETAMWIRCPLDASYVLQNVQGGRD